MKAGILCPGPSLARIPPLSDYQLLVGVNRAPFIVGVEVDAWCFDARAFLSGRIAYKPTLLCSAHDVAEISGARRIVLEDHHIFTHEYLLHYWPGPLLAWCDFSATSAIILAAHLGATSIDCYGSDWTCEPDADGVSLPSNRRTPERWGEEAIVWQKVTAYLGQRSISVERKSL